MSVRTRMGDGLFQLADKILKELSEKTNTENKEYVDEKELFDGSFE